jgi:hypothetical protein
VGCPFVDFWCFQDKNNDPHLLLLFLLSKHLATSTSSYDRDGVGFSQVYERHPVIGTLPNLNTGPFSTWNQEPGGNRSSMPAGTVSNLGQLMTPLSGTLFLEILLVLLLSFQRLCGNWSRWLVKSQLDRKDARTKLLNWDYSGFSQGGWLHSEPFHYTPTEQSNNQTENSNQIVIFLCITCTQWITIQPRKRRKPCYLWQHRWNQRLFCLVK